MMLAIDRLAGGVSRVRVTSSGVDVEMQISRSGFSGTVARSSNRQSSFERLADASQLHVDHT